MNKSLSRMLLSAHQLGDLGAGFIAGILPLYIGRKKLALLFLNFVVIGYGILQE